MRTYKSISNMLAFATSTLLLLSCSLFSDENVTPDNVVTTIIKTDNQKLYERFFSINSGVISGDTIIPQNDIRLHVNLEETNIDNLLNKDGSFKMVAIGGSMTAGAMNGGLYKNGQLTSFPNLLAIQMKRQYRLPLFGDKEFNGYGYKVLSSFSTENPVPKYKVVSNSLAIKETKPEVQLNKYEGEIDNLGIPYLASYSLGWSSIYPPINSVGYALKTPIPYLGRILNENSASEYSILGKILNRKIDFFTIELGTQNFLEGETNIYQSSVKPALLQIIEFLDENKAKGCIANIPDVTDFPYFHFVTPKQARIANQAELYINLNNSFIPIPNEAFLLPTPAIDSLMNPSIKKTDKNGVAFNKPLLPENVWLPTKINSLQKTIIENNSIIDKWSKTYNFPIVDFYTLFKKITAGNFTTDDGVRVTIGMKGNFYSSDGINISSFGQAIITNEYVKVINSFYKTKIPLIKTAYYLDK